MPKKSYLSSNIVIVSFLFAYIMRTLFFSSANQIRVSKVMPGEEAPTDESFSAEDNIKDGKEYFDHPFLQVMAAIFGEFMFTIGYYIYMTYVAD